MEGSAGWPAEVRDSTIEEICAGFVQPSHANRRIYRYILEILWPPGHDLPGPIVRFQDLHDHINERRAEEGKGPYKDVFRRFRELYGEEGLLGVLKKGSTYQLLDATIHEKRIPRANLSEADWEEVKAHSGYRCAVCRTPETATAFLSPDHKVPRLRLNDVGLDHIDGESKANYQALCNNCNIHKSVACRGCQAYCLECPWAAPESNPLVTIRGVDLTWLTEVADDLGSTPQEVIEELLLKARQEGVDDQARRDP